MALDFIASRRFKSAGIDATAAPAAYELGLDDMIEGNTIFIPTTVLVIGLVGAGMTVQPTIRVSSILTPGDILPTTALTLPAGDLKSQIIPLTMQPVTTWAPGGGVPPAVTAEVVTAATADLYIIRVWLLGELDSDFYTTMP